MNQGMRFIFGTKPIWVMVLLILATPSASNAASQSDQLAESAEHYVRLGLELGQYDTDYVDAYLGPKEWQDAAATPRTKQKLGADIKALADTLSRLSFKDPSRSVRHKSLSRNVRAMDTRIRMLNGEKFSFADEAFLIYDVVLPEFDFTAFDQALIKIDAILPGNGDLASRVDAFRSTFDIPPERLEELIAAAIDECRLRSKRYISMPEKESFSLEYVTGKSWSGYNWYQGNNVSLMQINQDFPTKIDRAIGLGAMKAIQATTFGTS